MSDNKQPPSIGEKIMQMNPRLKLEILDKLIESKKEEIRKLLDTEGTRKDGLEKMTLEVFWERFLKLMVKFYREREKRAASAFTIGGNKVDRRDFLLMTGAAMLGGGTGASVGLAVELWKATTTPQERKIDMANLSESDIAKAAADHAKKIINTLTIGAAIGAGAGVALSVAEIYRRIPQDINTPEGKMADIIELPETRQLIVDLYEAGLGMLEPMKVFEMALELHFYEMQLAQLKDK